MNPIAAHRWSGSEPSRSGRWAKVRGRKRSAASVRPTESAMSVDVATDPARSSRCAPGVSASAATCFAGNAAAVSSLTRMRPAAAASCSWRTRDVSRPVSTALTFSSPVSSTSNVPEWTPTDIRSFARAVGQMDVADRGEDAVHVPCGVHRVTGVLGRR